MTKEIRDINCLITKLMTSREFSYFKASVVHTQICNVRLMKNVHLMKLRYVLMYIILTCTYTDIQTYTHGIVPLW